MSQARPPSKGLETAEAEAQSTARRTGGHANLRDDDLQQELWEIRWDQLHLASLQMDEYAQGLRANHGTSLAAVSKVSFGY
jgi:hypothetical protein